MTSSVVGWVPVFDIHEVARMILDGFMFLQKERQVAIYAYVIMKDHIHFIASGENLSKKVRLFKSYTAREIIDYLKKTAKQDLLQSFVVKDSISNRSEYQFWQNGFHPKQIVGDKMMLQKIEYIHKNPVIAGYVDDMLKWEYSSICNYLDQETCLEITCFRR
nr:transposase [Aliifodinibius salipaludis]